MKTTFLFLQVFKQNALKIIKKIMFSVSEYKILQLSTVWIIIFLKPLCSYVFYHSLMTIYCCLDKIGNLVTEMKRAATCYLSHNQRRPSSASSSLLSPTREILLNIIHIIARLQHDFCYQVLFVRKLNN
jgi:hypothetical protein